MIGIIGAMQVEVEHIKAVMTDVETKTISGIEFCRGKISGKDTVAAKCGIGKVFASVCAEAMILRYNPDVIVNIGVAGTLTNELNTCLLYTSSVFDFRFFDFLTYFVRLGKRFYVKFVINSETLYNRQNINAFLGICLLYTSRCV